jgi:hypothetical protein
MLRHRPAFFSPACFLLPGFFFDRPCGNQMGTEFLEVVCDEYSIGGRGEYCGDNTAYLGIRHSCPTSAGWLFWNIMAHSLFGEEDSTSSPRWL